MATRDGKVIHGDDKLGYAFWTGLTDDTSDVGEGVRIGRFPDKSVQVVGTFGTGGEVQIEGSNDGGTTWGRLRDPQGTLLAIQDSNLVLVGESPLLIRPVVSAGDGTTDLACYISFVERGP